MSVSQDIEGPFPFHQTDLDSESLIAGVRHTLSDFFRWRDRHHASVAAHVDLYTGHLKSITSGGRFPSGLTRRVVPALRRREARNRIVRDANYFAIYNLGELLDPAEIADTIDGFPGRLPVAANVIADIGRGSGVAGVVDALCRWLPELAGVPETTWLAERLERLFRALPESVVRAGGMGKVVRAMAGVLAIGAYDTLHESPATKRDHLARILPGAYALGAAYVIVDDTLQDMPAGYVSAADRERCHRAVAAGLATGVVVAESDVPDHPLAEELHLLFGMLLKSHPFGEYRHLYHAAEAMYHAQHRDGGRAADGAAGGRLEELYQDIVLKSGMSRVVANILGRREPRDERLSRCLNTVVLGQFKDDLRDREEDARANRLTPFTFPYDGSGANPLYDLFAYDAYAACRVYGADPRAADALAYVGAVKLVTCLPTGPAGAEELIRAYGATPEIARCLRAATGVPHRVARTLEPSDTRLKDHCAEVLRDREQTSVDARTFVADRLGYINDVTRRCYARENPTGLEEIVAYAMAAPGKRLRAALGLMLAEGLGVDPASVEPFVAASELFHTASLLFDDLPAQDNAAVRRGRPTAHTVFDEGSVQLAAVSMISTGFGLLARLGTGFPAEKVTEVIAYVGTVLGPDHLCRGQDLDLRMGRSTGEVSGEEILRMYELKTSTTIEASLVPLMMLLDRPAEETDLVRRYARHAGIVFQIRDDILDLTSSTEALGKDAGNDVGKINVVRVYGLDEARRLMGEHLDRAVDCCARLPFDTRLLEGMVGYFATRRK